VNAQIVYSAAVAAMVYRKGLTKLQDDGEGQLVPKTRLMELSKESKVFILFLLTFDGVHSSSWILIISNLRMSGIQHGQNSKLAIQMVLRTLFMHFRTFP
jgi:hypothetical protein